MAIPITSPPRRLSKPPGSGPSSPKPTCPASHSIPPRLLYYWCVHLRVVDPPSFVIDISDYWDAKRKAVECFASQFLTGRPEKPPTFIDRVRDQAAYWGWSIGTRYAEPFWSREPIGLTSLRDLVALPP